MRCILTVFMVQYLHLMVDDPNVRVELFENASVEDLQASDDPVVQFVLLVRPLTKAIELSNMNLVRPRGRLPIDETCAVFRN